MVGAYTLPELRIQLKIFRLRLGANEREDADKIFYDDLPDSWNVLRLGALEDTLKMILDGHLTWAGIQELFEREAMTGEWVTSIGNLGLNYWLPSLVNAAVGWVTRGPTEQRTFQQWIQDHNIPWRTVVGRKPSETNWKIIRKLLLYLQGGRRLVWPIQYRDLEPEADGNPADNEPEETRGMDFVFERRGGEKRCYCCRVVSQVPCILHNSTPPCLVCQMLLHRCSLEVIEISDSSDDDNAEADSDGESESST